MSSQKSSASSRAGTSQMTMAKAALILMTRTIKMSWLLRLRDAERKQSVL